MSRNKKLMLGLVVGLLVVTAAIASIATATGVMQADDTETGGEVENIQPGTLNITDTQAREAALAAYPGTSVLSVDLDAESGTLVYDLELDNGTEVNVNAQTGEVIGLEQDDADGNDEDDSNEAEGNNETDGENNEVEDGD